MTKNEKQKLRKAIDFINGTSEDDEGNYDEGMRLLHELLIGRPIPVIQVESVDVRTLLQSIDWEKGSK
jgi:hypothetical protein